MELQRSNVRQTRSMTRAAAKKAKKSNLLAKELNCDHYDASLGATMIDADRANDRDCAGCDRMNSAEMYMVQCNTCGQWYHFSCGNVTSATVRDSVFKCFQCAQRDPVPPPSSLTDSQSNKSSRRAQIDRELERLEEEKRLLDEMESQQLAQEQALLQKARLEKMERMKLYLAKKYDLQSQQDDCDEGASVNSFRSNRTSRNRVGEWIENQRKVVSDTDLVIAKRVATPLSVDPILPTTATPVERLNTKFASTPLAKDAREKIMPPQISLNSPTEVNTNSLMRTLGDAVVDQNLRDDSEAVPKGNSDKKIISAIPQVNVQPLLEMLEEAQAGPANINFVPKTGKIVPSYDIWRKQTEAWRNRKECGEGTSREFALEQRVKMLEMEQEKVLYDQQLKERELQVQLQRMQQSQRIFDEQNCELERLRALEHDFRKQLALQQQEVESYVSENRNNTKSSMSSNHSLLVENPSRSLTGGVIHGKWIISDMEKSKQSHEGDTDEAGVNYCASAVSVSDQFIPPLSEINCSSSFSYRQPINVTTESPIGGRSNYTHSMSPTNYAQYMPQINIPHMPQSQPRLPFSPFAPQFQRCTMLPTLSNVPTTQQIAARQVISKELPIFTGDPIDWPLFISSYQHSTAVCGFSDSENLLRLQRCLKGSAKEAVSSLLLHPSTVPQILVTLQTLYGRPEQIVQTMVAKVRDTPAPKANRLETLVKFGLMVQNLAAHLKAIGQEKHLSNLVLLQELVDKLPDTVKFNWALYQQELPSVDLSSFSDYMAKIASATSGVTSGTVDIRHAQRDDRKSKERRETQFRARLFVQLAVVGFTN